MQASQEAASAVGCAAARAASDAGCVAVDCAVASAADMAGAAAVTSPTRTCTQTTPAPTRVAAVAAVGWAAWAVGMAMRRTRDIARCTSTASQASRSWSAMYVSLCALRTLLRVLIIGVVYTATVVDGQ